MSLSSSSFHFYPLPNSSKLLSEFICLLVLFLCVSLLLVSERMDGGGGPARSPGWHSSFHVYLHHCCYFCVHEHNGQLMPINLLAFVLANFVLRSLMQPHYFTFPSKFAARRLLKVFRVWPQQPYVADRGSVGISTHTAWLVEHSRIWGVFIVVVGWWHARELERMGPNDERQLFF